MPNWCYNTLRVEGEEGQVNKFRIKAFGSITGEYLDLRNIVPIPGTEGSDPNTPPNQDVYIDFVVNPARREILSRETMYDWYRKNWGTDRNTREEAIIKAYKGKLIIHFVTADTPPEPIVLAMSKQFPSLLFKLYYYEVDWGFNGRLIAILGAATSRLVIRGCQFMRQLCEGSMCLDCSELSTCTNEIETQLYHKRRTLSKMQERRRLKNEQIFKKIS